MAQEIRISKQGIDAGTVINPDDMTFSSEHNTLKYDTTGSAILTIPSVGPFDSETRKGTVAHNLGYYPYFSLYVKEGYASVFYPHSIVSFGAGANTLIGGYVGTTDFVYFYTSENNGAGTLTPGTANFVYKIFRNNLNL